ncbi:hypothetical protein WDV06_26475 [Streptomyces racemochromogenes]|uniref:Uncharacterized protein n=1 Tax=Streptomyces racemochromogenes TaxID=67353 RepID=A0ABW7PJL8_9ACTN
MTPPSPTPFGDDPQPAPVPPWRSEGLARLQATLVRAMLRCTTTPLGGGPVVRAVLPLPQQPDVVRVVVWDGVRLTTSQAYDVPLLDRGGHDIPAARLVAAVRHLVRHPAPERQTEADLVRDAYGIPVMPSETLREFLDAHPTALDITDSLHAAATALTAVTDTGEQDLLLLGFLLLDSSRARLYVTGNAQAAPYGIDVALRDAHGVPRAGITGLAAALPGLIAEDQLRYNPSDQTDPYCSQVFDLTHW